jgi:hypothetical protein
VLEFSERPDCARLTHRALVALRAEWRAAEAAKARDAGDAPEG